MFAQFIKKINYLEDYLNKPFRRTQDYLDTVRYKLQSDPSKRSLKNRWKQLLGYSFNSLIFLAKQPINLVVKPVQALSNLTKFFAIGAGMMLKENKEVCSYKALADSGKKFLYNTGETLVAGTTCFLAVSLVGAPAAVAVGFAANSAAAGVMATANNLTIKALVLLVAADPTTPVGIALNVENAVESVYHTANYVNNNPVNFDKKPELKEQLKQEYIKVKDEKLSIAERREAFERMQKAKSELEGTIIKKLKNSFSQLFKSGKNSENNVLINSNTIKKSDNGYEK